MSLENSLPWTRETSDQLTMKASEKKNWKKAKQNSQMFGTGKRRQGN
jgi:hypothetical protein